MIIDLRSDTVTKPTPPMRRAMSEAEVGDDVYGEDPTVRKLEERVAEMLGKQASLFLPSGTMGNTIGIKLHTRHGEEVICDHRAHILDWEMSMMAWFSGCLARPVPTEDGVLRWSDIEPVIRPRGTGFPAPTAMVNIEHPHNMGGGTLFSTDNLDAICDRAHERALKVHMDGARLFNAVAASGETAARIVAKTDTVMFCLSKGLGAPVGSMLAGDAATMAEARLYRKRLGGGMRQAGILAAAGLIALEGSGSHMQDDHANAKLMAERIGIDPTKILINKPQTNIVIFDIARTGLEPADFLARLKSTGILAGSVGGSRIRLVTHYDVSREDCIRAAEAIAALLA
jgi:threonine aldolase